MFSAYRQEVNLKFYNFQNILLTFFFSGPMYAQEISASTFVDLCFVVVVSEISSYFPNTS
jgi:hypothetical protein